MKRANKYIYIHMCVCVCVCVCNAEPKKTDKKTVIEQVDQVHYFFSMGLSEKEQMTRRKK